MVEDRDRWIPRQVLQHIVEDGHGIGEGRENNLRDPYRKRFRRGLREADAFRTVAQAAVMQKREEVVFQIRQFVPADFFVAQGLFQENVPGLLVLQDVAHEQSAGAENVPDVGKLVENGKDRVRIAGRFRTEQVRPLVEFGFPVCHVVARPRLRELEERRRDFGVRRFGERLVYRSNELHRQHDHGRDEPPARKPFGNLPRKRKPEVSAALGRRDNDAKTRE